MGFRVKSGWAMAVLLTGPASAPKVIARRRVELADPSDREAVQPFHAVLDLPKAKASRVVRRLVARVEQFAETSLASVIKSYGAGDHRLIGAGIVVGSTVDPQTIKNGHIRAHAEEGRLFRVVTQSALKLARLKYSVTLEKELLEKAAQVLCVSERKLKAELTTMGKAVEGSWRAEEKAATLAAWIELARRPR